MRSGLINPNVGFLRYANVSGYVWSSVASSKHGTGSATPGAYDMVFGVNGVIPSLGPDFRWISLPLRWLVVVSGGEYQTTGYMDQMMSLC